MAALGLFAFLPYLNTLWNDFVYDDVTQVTANPYIVGFHHLREILTTPVWSFLGAYGAHNYYRPVMTLGYLLCYQVFGMRPWGFHLANVALHSAVTLLLFGLTLSLCRDRCIAFCTAALFAIHPVHTESVAWIGAITDIELTILFFAGFWCFLQVGRSTHVRWWQAGMVVSYALCLLSKETAVTLPVLATAYEHGWRRDRARTRLRDKLSRYAPLWLMVAGYLTLRVYVVGAVTGKGSRQPGYAATIAAGAQLAAGYFYRLVWPARMCIYWMFHPAQGWLDPRALMGLALVGGIVALFRFLYTRPDVPDQDDAMSGARLAAFGLVWMMVTLGIVLNVRWMPDNALAERYLYLPSVGFSWVAAWAGIGLWQFVHRRARAWRFALAAAVAAIVIAGVVRIVTRNRDWHDEVRLFTRTLEVQPDAYPIRNDLGSVYWSRGNVEEAERQWLPLANHWPPSPPIINNLGLVYKHRKRYAEAERAFVRAIEISPEYTKAYVNLGDLYAEAGYNAGAEAQYVKALRLSPLSVQAHNGLGKLYLNEHRLEAAESEFLKSLQTELNIIALDGLGGVYREKKNLPLAEKAYLAALKLHPADAPAHFGLAAVYLDSGRAPLALEEYERGLKIDPDNADARAAVERLQSEH
jgi:tetratricopeptide (TPR) repeat protein